MDKKEPERSRNILIRLFVNEKEKRAIRKRMEEAGMKNFSRYARLMLLYGRINKVDVDEIRETRIALNRIGTNLNQIAKRVNENGEASADEIGNALEIMREVKQTLNDVLYSKLNADDSVRDESEGMTQRQSVSVDMILEEQLQDEQEIGGAF